MRGLFLPSATVCVDCGRIPGRIIGKAGSDFLFEVKMSERSEIPRWDSRLFAVAAIAALACAGGGRVPVRPSRVTTDSIPMARAQVGPRLGQSTLDGLMFPRAGRTADYTSYDRKFANDDFRTVAPGETITLVDHEGAGIVRRWWVTIAPLNNPEIQRQLIVRCYWDEEAEPSVEVPVSDFFGVGFGEWRQYVSLPLNMTSGGYNSYWAMPFRRHARITIENRSPIPVERLYYNIAVE